MPIYNFNTSNLLLIYVVLAAAIYSTDGQRRYDSLSCYIVVLFNHSERWRYWL